MSADETAADLGTTYAEHRFPRGSWLGDRLALLMDAKTSHAMAFVTGYHAALETAPDAIERVIREHSGYSDGECTGCGALIGMLPDDNPIPVHQADMVHALLTGGAS